MKRTDRLARIDKERKAINVELAPILELYDKLGEQIDRLYARLDKLYALSRCRKLLGCTREIGHLGAHHI